MQNPNDIHTYSIFNLNNAEKFTEILSSHNIDTDIYFVPSFLSADAELQGGEYEIFSIFEGEHYFIYPYILSPFKFNNELYYDLISPYGYSGPICNNLNLLKEAEHKFIAYIKQKGNVITEFVRYHYLVKPEFMFNLSIKNQFNRDIVTLNLEKTWEEIFSKSFSSTARNLMRKIEKNGYIFEIDEDFSDYDGFIQLYYDNMDHAAASDFYYFPKNFFYKLKDNLKKKLKLAHLKKDGIIYCSSLFFLQNGIISYYLSGRNLKFPDVPGNYSILGMMIKWGVENHFKLFNFGGGRTQAGNDKLLTFKSHFSKDKAPFFTGKRIHSEKIYDQLKADYIERNGVLKFEEVQNILQFYR